MAAQQQPKRAGCQHILLVCFAAQSHVNPAIRLARRLTSQGVRVTFSTAIYAHRLMFPEAKKDCSFPLPDPNDPLLFYHPYSDGYDDRPSTTVDVPPEEFMERVHQVGSETLRTIVTSPTLQLPFTCVINTLFLPWVVRVALDLSLPFATFWIQPASLFLVYYHYFHGYRATIDDVSQKFGAADIYEAKNTSTSVPNDRCSTVVNLPGLPCLETLDFPSFLVATLSGSSSIINDGDSLRSGGAENIPNSWKKVILRDIGTSIQILDEALATRGKKPKVLVNTFDALEKDALAVLRGVLDFLPVGMVLPPACTDSEAAASPASDFVKHNDKAEYMMWLDRWPDCSVVYISFGSYSTLGMPQIDEFVKALRAIRRPFLWVVRKDVTRKPDEASLGDKGKVVAWCDQLEVLRHSSVGCFVTHCGWNSTAEAITAGVPMVAMPQWTDQPMNARLIDGVWRNGVRAAARQDGVVPAAELERCVELIMGNAEEGAGIRRKAAELGENGQGGRERIRIVRQKSKGLCGWYRHGMLV